ncbi:hypothetical protein J2T15_001617 [Paenibacillus harenae]|uniref:Uncharacterized protein n=1 Tax=Paenibacillus harenae TaxID=306543 RepID=A0ABT9TYV0_PAEHA|nr:hypothetical protein [Paenibacillus harenae]MDQ0112182.1 hypothetical protein [Paenibacillus harenae]
MTNRDGRGNESQMDSGMILASTKVVGALYKKDFVSMSASAHAGKAFVVY